VGEFKIGAREILLGTGAVFLIVGIGLNLRQRYGQEEGVEIISAEKTVTPMVQALDQKIWVEAAGSVMGAGVYELEGGARVNDLLVESGGLSAEADREWVEKNLNRARKLEDGEKIYIPKTGEEEEVFLKRESPEEIRGVSSGGLVNLNTASQGELESLSGIGPAFAGRIIEYREKNGGFRDINEVKLVSGIGEKLFEGIKDGISI